MPLWAAVAAVALYMGPSLVGVFGAALCVWTPAPLVAVYRRLGQSAGRRALAWAMAGALLAHMDSGGMGGVYFAYFAAMALVLGESPRVGLRMDWAVAGAALAASLLVLAGILGAASYSGLGVGGVWDSFWAAETRLAVRLYRQSGLDPSGLENLQQHLFYVGRVIAAMAPALVISVSLLIAWGNLLLSRRLDPAASGPSGLAFWQAPEQLVWPLIAAGLAMVFGWGMYFWAAANLMLVLVVIYFFQGLAVMAFWMDKKNAPRLVRVSIYLLVAVEFFLALLVAAAGLFDTWFNFRRMGLKPDA